MKKFEKFLFFYSIIVITVLVFSFGIFSPKPINLISIATLSPLTLYFWIRLTSPQGTDPNIWTVRFLIVLIVLTALGIYGFNLYKTQEILKSQTPKTFVMQKTTTPTPTDTKLPKSDVSLSDILMETPQATDSANEVQ